MFQNTAGGMPIVILREGGKCKIRVEKHRETTRFRLDVEAKLLMKIAMTSMYSKIVSEDSHLLSQIDVNATKQVAEKRP